MRTVVISGVAGLVGSEAARFFGSRGFRIVGIDNDMRSHFFGEQASTKWQLARLEASLPDFTNEAVDIRDYEQVSRIFADHSSDVALVIHSAAQPSHDWAAREPITDFTVNANGTLSLLEAARQHCPEAVFIFTSTNKVYGDRPNALPLVELETRWEIAQDHEYYADGIDEQMPIDQCLHSLFGASKVAADVLVQEYGRYFGMKTGVFRGGCLTGPAHSGAELHGFLAWLVKCAVTQTPYHVYGYQGKQVRDNIHSNDLIQAMYHFFRAPRPGEVYNIGGGRFSNCSLLEAIQITDDITGCRLKTEYSETNRTGDHIWWISDVSKFKAHYPEWRLTRNIRDIIADIHTSNEQRWTAADRQGCNVGSPKI